VRLRQPQTPEQQRRLRLHEPVSASAVEPKAVAPVRAAGRLEPGGRDPRRGEAPRLRQGNPAHCGASRESDTRVVPDAPQHLDSQRVVFPFHQPAAVRNNPVSRSREKANQLHWIEEPIPKFEKDEKGNKKAQNQPAGMVSFWFDGKMHL
jgi:hypothetical protein